ncbi:MAG: hypothetical protein DWQ34_25220 [Planctomycetota bacterium]|nr:MAG: hypothetical protein DWQ34_25220 [Planctomycetota bacterium]REK27322.1 MAG: hypothetical protein DWQ41_08135 [Planctomycetota bacterium]REK36657.1 MAG: hypothetical protein DWQ45_08500 [Planctomycetota bacterium]
MTNPVDDSFAPGDGGRKAALRLFSYAFLTSGSYLIARTLADGLFLGSLGPGALPLAMLMAACVVTPCSVFWTWASRRISMIRVVIVTRIALAVATSAVAWLLPARMESVALLWVLYLIAELRGCLNTIQLTTLLNETLPRSAHHLAPSVAAGAPLAGIATGLVIGLELGTVSYAQLLIGAAILDLASIIPLILRTGDSTEAREDGTAIETGEAEPVAPFESAIVRSLVILISVKVAVLTIASFEWKVAAATVFSHRDEDLSRYFALFYAVCDVVTLLIQFFAAGGLLRRYGIAVGLAALPVALGLCLLGGLLSVSSAALLFWMTCAKGADVLRRGLHDPTLMIIYGPIQAVRRRQVIGMVNGLLKPVMEAAVVFGIFAIGFLANRTESLFVVAAVLMPIWFASSVRTLSAYRASASVEE